MEPTPSTDRALPPFEGLVFDFDSTLSFLEGIDELVAGLDENADQVRSEIRQLTARAMAGELPLEDVYGRRLAHLSPTKGQVDAVARAYGDRLVPGVRAFFRALRWLSKDVAVVSGGLRPALLPVTRDLEVPDERVFAVDVRFGDDGAYQGYDEASPLARGGGKQEIIDALFPGGEVGLVGDGATDLEAKGSCALFVGFAGVERRAKVVAEADAVCELPDFAALVHLLLSPKEIERLRGAGDPEIDVLLERARALAKAELLGPSSSGRALSDASPAPAPPTLWIPGPTQVRTEILRSMTAPMIGHRTSAMVEIIRDLDPHLRLAFGVDAVSPATVAVHSCTATALMEMSLRALDRGSPEAGPARVLCLVNGSFSERYAEIAELCGLDVVRVRSPLGAPADLEQAAQRLQGAEAFDAVTVCLSETSTGALTEPTDIAQRLAGRGRALLLVDAVTYLGAGPVHAVQNGFDFTFAGTQKALALPPGLGLYCVSDRMMNRTREAQDKGRLAPGFFLDLVRITEGHRDGAPPMTPTISLHRALLQQLETITSGALEVSLAGEEARGRSGWSMRFARHRAMRDAATLWLDSMGLSRPGGAGHWEASPSVLCMDLTDWGPAAVKTVVETMGSRGLAVAKGYGPLKGTHVRIGHMGDHTTRDFRAVLGEVSGILKGLDRSPD